MPPAASMSPNPSPHCARRSQRDFGVAVLRDNAAAAADGAGVWVLAVKPQVMRGGRARSWRRWRNAQRPLVVSIAAGITTRAARRAGSAAASRWCARCRTRRRCSAPASPACSPTPRVDAAAARARRALLARGRARPCGSTTRALMDAVTAVSGSGPAYVFLLAEAMQAAGVRAGPGAGRRARAASADHARRGAHAARVGRAAPTCCARA